MADMSVAVLKSKGAELKAEQQRVEEIAATTDTVNEPPPAPVDFSFFSLTTVEDAVGEEPRKPTLGKCSSPRGHGGKFAGRCLRMNNNQLSEIKSIKTFAEKTFINAKYIGWIDLSFNALPTIDPVLLEFTSLEILYLHGNCIANIKEVDKLAQIPTLRKLTLHGNEIEKEKGYRMYVLSSMPWLRNFDFSAVTKCEARTAETWKRFNNTNKKKKKIEAED